MILSELLVNISAGVIMFAPSVIFSEYGLLFRLAILLTNILFAIFMLFLAFKLRKKG